MNDVANKINTWIAKKLKLPAITNDAFVSAEGFALCCVHVQGDNDVRHVDGTKIHRRIFEYRCRSPDAFQARETLESLLSLVDGKSLRGKCFAIYTDAKTSPAFIGVDDKNQTVYSCTVQVKY